MNGNNPPRAAGQKLPDRPAAVPAGGIRIVRKDAIGNAGDTSDGVPHRLTVRFPLHRWGIAGEINAVANRGRDAENQRHIGVESHAGKRRVEENGGIVVFELISQVGFQDIDVFLVRLPGMGGKLAVRSRDRASRRHLSLTG